MNDGQNADDVGGDPGTSTAAETQGNDERQKYGTMSAGQDIGPGSDTAMQAYRRLHKAIVSIEKLGLLPSTPADLRYGQELTSEIYGAVVMVLVRKGLISQDELNAVTIEALNDRAAAFEQRVHAWLDGRKDMPR